MNSPLDKTPQSVGPGAASAENLRKFRGRVRSQIIPKLNNEDLTVLAKAILRAFAELTYADAMGWVCKPNPPLTAAGLLSVSVNVNFDGDGDVDVASHTSTFPPHASRPAFRPVRR